MFVKQMYINEDISKFKPLDSLVGHVFKIVCLLLVVSLCDFHEGIVNKDELTGVKGILLNLFGFSIQGSGWLPSRKSEIE